MGLVRCWGGKTTGSGHNGWSPEDAGPGSQATIPPPPPRPTPFYSMGWDPIDSAR